MKQGIQNKVRTLMVLGMTAAVFAGCPTNGNDGVINGDGRVEVRFGSGGVSAAARVVGNHWEANDPIGIYMVKHGTDTVAESAENIQYTSLSSGEKTIFASATPVSYPQDGSKVDFIAYHPYQQPLANWTYHVDVNKQDSQSGIDLMWTGKVNNSDNSAVGYDKDYPSSVNLPFTHQLVKLELDVQAGAGVAGLDGLAVSIKGMNTAAEFDLKAGALSSEGSPDDITPKKDAGSGKYEAILLPVGTLDANHTIEFTLDGNTYVWNLSGAKGITSGELEAHKKYEYTITITKAAVAVNGTITDWTTTTGTGTAQ